jgi:hypothetical protein
MTKSNKVPGEYRIRLILGFTSVDLIVSSLWALASQVLQILISGAGRIHKSREIFT